MVRYVVLWGYESRGTWKYEALGFDNVLRAEAEAGKRHGLLIPASQVRDVIAQLRRAAEGDGGF